MRSDGCMQRMIVWCLGRSGSGFPIASRRIFRKSWRPTCFGPLGIDLCRYGAIAWRSTTKPSSLPRNAYPISSPIIPNPR